MNHIFKNKKALKYYSPRLKNKNLKFTLLQAVYPVWSVTDFAEVKTVFEE